MRGNFQGLSQKSCSTAVAGTSKSLAALAGSLEVSRPKADIPVD